VYVPTLVSVTLRSGAQLRALSFVANRASQAYQRLKEAEVLRRLRHCHGGRGSNRDYALNTFHALRERGVHDAHLAGLIHRLLSEHPAEPAPGDPDTGGE
ncbi:MAG: hypothetical protein VW257_01050, partial [Quisquiliibacterium sp.]